jgi:hypothetical protein
MPPFHLKCIKKASIPLKMFLICLAIFEKRLNFSKNVFKKSKASNSLKISLKCTAFLKKDSHSQKNLVAIAALPQ